MKHSKRLQRQRARRSSSGASSSARPVRPLWVQLLILAMMGSVIIWAVLLNTGLIPNVFGFGKWTRDLFPTDPRVEFGEALDQGRYNVEAAKAIVDGDYRLVGELQDGLTRPIGVTCQPGKGPNWGDRAQFRFIVADTDLMVRSAQTDPRQIRIRKYYGEAYNKAVVTFEEYPYKEECRYTGTRLDGLAPVLPDQFGIVAPRRTDEDTSDETDADQKTE